MLLVIDANIVFAAAISPRGTTCDLLFSPGLEFIAPEFLKEELEKYFSLLVIKSGTPAKEVQIALELILSRIKILPFIEYERHREQARKISPDPKDEEYFAVALAFDCPLWSNDKRLKGQSVVRVFSTNELLQRLG